MVNGKVSSCQHKTAAHEVPHSRGGRSENSPHLSASPLPRRGQRFKSGGVQKGKLLLRLKMMVFLDFLMNFAHRKETVHPLLFLKVYKQKTWASGGKFPSEAHLFNLPRLPVPT